MSFKTHYYRIKDRILEDQAFLSSYHFLNVNTDLMEDEEVIRAAVKDYLYEFSTWPTKPSPGERDGRYWYLNYIAGLDTPPGQVIDGNSYAVLTRDHIQLPYFLGTRLKLNIDEFCDIVYYEQSDSWVWPLMMEFINLYVADGCITHKAPILYSIIQGSYAEDGMLLEPCLRDLKTYEQQKKYYRPPYIYKDTDDPVKLDQAREKMHSELKIVLKECIKITVFLEEKNLINNDIYTDYLEFQELIKETMILAQTANAYQLNAYFSDILHVNKYYAHPVKHQDERVHISKMEKLVLDNKVTYLNIAHNIKSNCAFDVTQPTREADSYKFECLKTRDYKEWGSRVWIADTFTKTDFVHRKFDMVSDIPALKAFTPYILTSRYAVPKGCKAEYPEYVDHRQDDTDIVALQLLDHIIDSSDLSEIALKNIPLIFKKIYRLLHYPAKIIQDMIIYAVSKRFKMIRIIRKVDKFLKDNDDIIKIYNIISKLQKTSPLYAAFQLILTFEKLTHPFFKRGRFIDCDDIPMSVSAFSPILELVFREIIEEINITADLVSLDEEERRLVIKYLSCRILKDIL